MYWMLGMPFASGVSSGQVVQGLPDVIVLPGCSILIQSENFDSGDNWNDPSFFVDEWLEAN